MGNRRQHIIELAAQVVYRQGFKGTSVENVLEIAGVGKGNFYHYFRSKDELGIAIIGEMEKWLNGAPGEDAVPGNGRAGGLGAGLPEGFSNQDMAETLAALQKGGLPGGLGGLPGLGTPDSNVPAAFRAQGNKRRKKK